MTDDLEGRSAPDAYGVSGGPDPRLPHDTLAIPNDRQPGEYTTFGDARYLRMHGCKNPVPVRLVEDPQGNYMTWLSYEDDERDPIFTLWHTIFDVQFPYGHKAEEAAGKGKGVRVRAEPREVAEGPEAVADPQGG